eukprot:TRINITY_DN15683_c0_g1_i23.p1 TRINITY_DN15683_c0_g1~~TRINITY_DN15683_c0_g1_i23.p1  ORF type:complete len:1065 (+),score=140.94 TRINITY_DN15683_c0_g1_i23:239-3433(+)
MCLVEPLLLMDVLDKVRGFCSSNISAILKHNPTNKSRNAQNEEEDGDMDGMVDLLLPVLEGMRMTVRQLGQSQPDLLARIVEGMGHIAKMMAQSKECTGSTGPSILDAALGCLRECTQSATTSLAAQIFRELIPLVSLSSTANSSSSPSKISLAVRAKAIDLATELSTQGGELVVRFLQHLCTTVADRTEPRELLASAVLEISCSAGCEVHTKFIKFVNTLSQSNKPHHRQLAVDISAACLLQTQKSQSPELVNTVPEMLELLRSRAKDRAPSVRTRALSHIAELVDCLMQLTSMSECESLVEIVRYRICDTKPMVRKAALQCLTAFGTCSNLETSQLVPLAQLLQVLTTRMRDLSAACRKQALNALTGIMNKQPTCAKVAVAWLNSALPVVMDPEQAVQEAAVQAVHKTLLQPLEGEEWDCTALLSSLAPSHLRYIQKSFGMLHAKGSLKPSMVRTLQEAALVYADTTSGQVNMPAASGVWLLVRAAVTHLGEAFDSEWIVSCWKNVSSPTMAPFALQILLVLGNICTSTLTAQDQSWIRNDLVSRLQSDEVGAIPNPVFDTTRAMCRFLAATTDEQSWSISLLKQCHKLLQDASADRPVQAELIESALFRTGELVQFLDSENSTQNTLRKELAAVTQSLIVEQPAGFPVSVKAHAFTALGKLCLDDISLARRCITIFLRELTESGHAIVRNNVLVVMCDLCRKHTALVDRHVGSMAVQMCHENPTVRRHAVALLAHLVHLDFLKLRGPTFYFMLLPLADKDPAISQLAKACLSGLLKHIDGSSTGMGVAASHIVETLFFLNKCTAHETYNQFGLQNSDMLDSFCGPDEECSHQRNIVYKALLEQMSDEQKFVVTEKLINEVVAGAADGQLDLTQCSPVILDALKILGSKAIRIGHRRNQQEDSTEVQEALSNAKGRFLSSVARRNLIENVIPTMTALKLELEKERSPLLGPLMTCFGAVLREYRQEATDVLASHPRLSAELAFDFRKPLGPSSSPVNMMKTPAPKSIHRCRSMTPKVMFGSTPGPRHTPASACKSKSQVVCMPNEAIQQQWNVAQEELEFEL